MKSKRFLKSVLFCCILLFLGNQVYKILSWKDTGGDYYAILDSFYGLEKDTVDVLFLGSSRCYCSVNNSALWKDYGISSFSLSISGQDLAGTYHCLAEALKTQKPKVVCIEAYGVNYEGYQVEGNLYRNILPLKLSKNSLEAAYDMVKEGDPRDYLFKWPIIHTRYAELKREDFVRDYPPYLGYYAEFQTETIWGAPFYQGTETLPISQENEKYLRQIMELAKQKDFSLFFFVVPYPAPEEDQKRYKSLESLLGEYQVPLLNMIPLTEELQMDVRQDYINWFHTNYFGAQKVTHYLGSYLKEHYSLADRRGDQRYRIWDEDARVRDHEVQNQLELRQTYDLSDYLELLCRLDGYTVFVSTDGNYLSQDTDISAALEDFGIGDEFYEGHHVWVWEDGQITYCSPEGSFLHYGDLAMADYALTDREEGIDVLIDRTSFQKTSDGINIVVYDSLLREVADAIGFYAPEGYATAK